jgi:DNA-binding MarR family transcriptional regulator
VSDDVSSASIVVRLAKVIEIVLDSAGLTPTQYRMLTLVADGDPSMRELSVRLVMKPPNITTLIDGLVQRKLVLRSRDADDRRRQVLALTAHGRRVLSDAERQCDDALARLSRLDSRSGARLVPSLDAWLPALDQAAVDLRAAVTPPPRAAPARRARSRRAS